MREKEGRQMLYFKTFRRRETAFESNRWALIQRLVKRKAIILPPKAPNFGENRGICTVYGKHEIIIF